MMKKFLPLLLILIISIVPLLSYAEEQEFIGDSTINYIKDQITQEEKVKNDKITQEKLKEEKVFLEKDKEKRDKSKNPQFAALGYTLYATYVPVYPQVTAYFCGPATALQTIGNWQYSSTWSYQAETVLSATKSLWWWGGCIGPQGASVTAQSNWVHPNSTTHTCYTSYTSPQVTLSNIMGTTTSGSDMTSVKNAINQYVNHPNHSYYATQSITSSDTSKSDLKNHTKFDFTNDHSSVYLVDTQYLARYAGKTSGHFISGYSYEDNGSYDTDMMGIADCNYNTTYGGSYRETFNNVHKALYNHGGINLSW